MIIRKVFEKSLRMTDKIKGTDEALLYDGSSFLLHRYSVPFKRELLTTMSELRWTRLRGALHFS